MTPAALKESAWPVRLFSMLLPQFLLALVSVSRAEKYGVHDSLWK